MQLIILLIIIFLVWRHFKKKKANKPDRQTSSQPSVKSASSAAQSGTNQRNGVDSSLSSEVKQKFQGCPLYTPQRFTGEDNRITILVEEKLSSKEKKQFADQFGAGTPEYAFACAKGFYDAYLTKYQNRKLNIGTSTAESITLWLDTAVILARYYQSGFGCERDTQAALNLIIPIEKFCSEQTQSVSASIQKDENVNNTFIHMANVYLSLAECYACVGKEKESNKYYRMALAMGKVHGENSVGQRLFERKVLKSALGGFPVPANVDIASELALKMIQQNKTDGAYALREIFALKEMDYNSIGKSYQQDFAIYLAAGRESGSSYAAYKLGECYLYGKGTEQNIELGLTLLYDASYAGSLNATVEIHDYFENFNTYSYRDERGKKLSSSASSAVVDLKDFWWDREENMENNTSDLAFMQKVIDGHAGAEEIIGKRVKPTIFQNIDEEKGDTDIENTSSDFFDFPYLIMDDWNRQWILDWNNGEEARYTLDPNFDQKTDIMDSLSDGVAYLKKADMRSGRATYMGRTFHW